MDGKGKRMFRIDGDNLLEITAPDIKLKITLESSVIPESRALKSAFTPSPRLRPPLARSAAASSKQEEE